MTRVFEECHHAGFAAVSAYALAGGRTVEEEGAELKSAIASFKDVVGTTGLQIYAMTVPTHYADRECRRHFGKSIHLQVRAMCLEAHRKPQRMASSCRHCSTRSKTSR